MPTRLSLQPPAIQIVEVPVVEERVVERIIEKEVFISIPEGQEAELCGHTKEEIRALVDDALARERTDLPVRARALACMAQRPGSSSAREVRISIWATSS